MKQLKYLLLSVNILLVACTYGQQSANEKTLKKQFQIFN
jgi:hypothetical protein